MSPNVLVLVLSSLSSLSSVYSSPAVSPQKQFTSHCLPPWILFVASPFYLPSSLSTTELFVVEAEAETKTEADAESDVVVFIKELLRLPPGFPKFISF